jgi:endoribonuclease Dicer
MRPRHYQIELFEQSKLGNSIVYLETGTGKTMISVLLMDHLTTVNPHNKTVFLAPTNALVHQQTTSIEDVLDYSISGYSFEPFMLSKSKQFWLDEWKRNQIIVMTPQLLVNLLQHGYIQISMIQLLVIDECHKSSGLQPIAVLMKQYYHNSGEKPTVLGMTASPLYQGKVSFENAKRSLMELQITLDSKLIAVTDSLLVNEFVQNATEHLVEYRDFNLPITTCSDCLGQYHTYRGYLIDFLSSSLRQTSFTDEVEMRILLKKHLDSLDMKERTGLATMEKHIFGLDHLLKEYGPLAALLYARKLYHSLYGNKRKVWDDFEITSTDISPKAIVLIELLKKYLQVEQGKQCIVFVDRKDCAESLCALLNHLAPNYQLRLQCGFAAGKTVTLSTTLDLFRNGKINVLISTRVTAEGIDMSTCLT